MLSKAVKRRKTGTYTETQADSQGKVFHVTGLFQCQHSGLSDSGGTFRVALSTSSDPVLLRIPDSGLGQLCTWKTHGLGARKGLDFTLIVIH